MTREPIWRRYLRFWGPAPEQDVDDELAFHIRQKIDDLVARGMDPKEAAEEAQRREIGVRVAVGATPAGVMGLVVRDSLKLVAGGLVLGIPGAIATMRTLSAFAYGLPPIDVPGLAAAILVLVATGIVATAGPARRAARVDPNVVLRAD